MEVVIYNIMISVKSINTFVGCDSFNMVNSIALNLARQRGTVYPLYITLQHIVRLTRTSLKDTIRKIIPLLDLNQQGFNKHIRIRLPFYDGRVPTSEMSSHRLRMA